MFNNINNKIIITIGVKIIIEIIKNNIVKQLHITQINGVKVMQAGIKITGCINNDNIKQK